MNPEYPQKTHKMGRPGKTRLTGHPYYVVIFLVKSRLELKYETIANWMGITAGNLRAMISKSINPTLEEWLKFKTGLQRHLNRTQYHVSLTVPISDCHRCGCSCGCREPFVKRGGTNYRCPKCKKCLKRLQSHTKYR